MSTSHPAIIIARIFAESGNALKDTAKGFECGHEPVHPSKSGTCVKIDSEKSLWYCTNCESGGDVVRALMSLRGISRDEAETQLREISGGEDEAGSGRESQADHLANIAKSRPLFHDEYREPYVVVPVNGHEEIL